MTREEVATVLSLMRGTPQLVAKMLYGSGLRIMEAVRLRVKDILEPHPLPLGRGELIPCPKRSLDSTRGPSPRF
jgi:integrase